MATYTDSSPVSGGSGSSKYRWRAYFTATTSSTDESYTIRVSSAGIQSYYAISSRGTMKLSSSSGVGISKSWSGNWSCSGNNSWQTINHMGTAQTKTIAKSTSAKSVSVSITCTIKGGYGNGTSSVSHTFSIPAGDFQEAALTPTNFTATRNSDTQITLRWTNRTDSTHAVTKNRLRVSRDDGSYSDIYNGTKKTSHVWTGCSANHAYQFAVRAINNEGNSSYVYSDTVYTTPAAPSSVMAVKTGTSVSLAAIVNNINWPNYYEWQRSTSSNFSTATTLDIDDASGQDTITTTGTDYWYRVRAVGQDETLKSAWTSVQMVENPLCYVRVPDGITSLAGVYIRQDQFFRGKRRYMKILNEKDQEIQQEDVDLSLGYLQPDKLFVEHHPEVQAKPAVWHYKVSAFYFTDGTSMKILSEEDPHIVDVDAKNGKFDFQEQPEDEIKGRELKGIDLEQVEDEPRVEHKAEWDEYEDIQRYILYTEEELAQMKAEAEKQAKVDEFIEFGPDRLTTVEVTTDDLAVAMADFMLQTMSVQEK